MTVFSNICNALAYAHSRNVIHRDLKPANIMIGDFGEVYVMDWGVAKVLSNDAASRERKRPEKEKTQVKAKAAQTQSGGIVKTNRTQAADMTQDGAIMGTPAYMPPEQARGEIDAIDQRSDVYSLGAILYEMLTLTPPVGRGGDAMAVLMRVVDGTIDLPAKRAPKRCIPPELSAVAMKALAMNPDDRYQTVEELQRDIQLFQEGRSVSAKHDSAWEMFKKLVKRNKGVSIATATALLVLLVGGGIAFKVNYAARVEAEDNYAAFLKEKEQRRASIPSFLTATRLLLDKRDFDGARAQVGLILDLDPEQREALFIRGQLAVIGQAFANAGADLEAYAKHRPDDVLAKDLLAFLPRAQVNDETTQLLLAEIFGRHQAYAMADGAVQSLGENALAARQKLLTLYRERIEKAWPGRGNFLTLAKSGALHLALSRKELPDLSPLHGLPLTSLDVGGCSQLRDLSPLRGLPLTSLICYGTQVMDLSPLSGMPLTSLNCFATPLVDLSPLKGLPLTSLNCGATKVTDLSPLKGLPLTSLTFSNTPVTDLSPLAGLPLTSLIFSDTPVTDLSPLAGLPLTSLNISQSTKVTDLSPLRGMPLTTLNCSGTSVADLSPLRGMLLTDLSFTSTPVTDLSPLRGMPLTNLRFYVTNVTDLSPLQGMSLAELDFARTKVADLSPLANMPLRKLTFYYTSVSDLSPLVGMPLTLLNCYNTKVTDLSPLEKMKLNALSLSPENITRGMDVVRNMKALTTIGVGVTGGTSYKAEDFWKRYDAGEFKKK